jgi:hypothetical protein
MMTKRGRPLGAGGTKGQYAPTYLFHDLVCLRQHQRPSRRREKQPPTVDT